jgi:hypothetical protein
MTASPATNEAGIIVTSSASRFARAVSIFPYCRIAAFHRSRLSLSPTGGSTSLGEKIESQDSWYECQSSSHVKLADGRGVPAAAAAANCSAEKRGIDSKRTRRERALSTFCLGLGTAATRPAFEPSPLCQFTGLASLRFLHW